MVIVESPIFTALIKKLMSDEEYRELQQALVIRPNLGDIIQGSGGLRKVRWRIGGSGNRGKSGVTHDLLLGSK